MDWFWPWSRHFSGCLSPNFDLNYFSGCLRPNFDTHWHFSGCLRPAATRLSWLAASVPLQGKRLFPNLCVHLFLVSWCGRCWYWCSFFFVIWWLCIWFDDIVVLGELCRFCHQGKQIISDLLISEARGRAFPWRCNKWDHPVRTWLQLLLVQSTIALIGAHNYKSIKTGARDLLYLQWTIGGNGSRCCKWRYCANGQDWWQHRNTLHIKT